jgi:hypothetical protein
MATRHGNSLFRKKEPKQSKSKNPMKMTRIIGLLFTGLAGLCFFGNHAAGAQLLGSAANIGADRTPETNIFNLTAEGTLDWIFWESSNNGGNGPFVDAFDHKIGGDQISDLSAYGETNIYYDGQQAGSFFTWSDGTPDQSVTETNWTFFNCGLSNGLQFTVQADTTTRYLKIWGGDYGGGITFQATLSDNSAPPFSAVLYNTRDDLSHDVFTLQFAADSPGQTLNILLFVNYEGPSDGIYTSACFSAAALASNPPPPQIFFQPVSQATNNIGVAQQFTVLAFGGLPLSYQWLAEANGAYVPLADGGQISGSTTPTLTISNLAAANATNYYVVVSNNWGAVTSSVANLTLLPLNGNLSATPLPVPLTVDLTAAGTLDWAAWGETSGAPPNYLEQKAGGTNLISDVTTFGDPASGPNQFSDASIAFNWSNGTPDAAETNEANGIYYNSYGGDNGFQLTVPASTNKEILTVYMGAYLTTVHFEASLSDQSAPVYVDDSFVSSAAAYTVEFAAGTNDQTLTITVYGTVDVGNCSLMAATLAGPEPDIVVQPASMTNNATTTAQLTAQTEGWGPLSYQWWVETNGVYIPLADAGQISGSGTSTLSISNLAAANATNYYVVITNSYGAVTSSVVTLTVRPITGILIGAALPPPPTLDLTAAGTLDWAAWGVLTGAAPNYLEHKAGGTNQISDVTTFGDPASGPNQFGNAIIAASWSDGAPDPAVTNTTTGIYYKGIENGYQISVPADTTQRILTVYAGGYSTTVNFKAALSDDSAPPYVDTSVVDPGANSIGSAAAFTLEFAAGASGQTLTVTVTCDADYGAANVTLIAATLAGPQPNIVLQPASMTNNVGTTAQLTALAGGWAPLSYQWWQEANGAYAALAGGGPFSGSTTPTLAISNLSLANGTNYYLVVSNAYGVVTSSVAKLTVLPVTGTLIGSAATPPANVNLTAEGTLDWADWGEFTGLPPNYLEQKAGGSNQISDATAIGVGSGPNSFGGTVITTFWSDGTPDAAEVNTNGIYYVGLDNGYQITVPADTTKKILTVYAGGYGTIVNFTAAISDASAPPYVDESLVDPGGNSPGSADAYTMQFAAGSANQTLTVNVTCAADYGGGNVTLMAATLQGAPVTLQIGYVGSKLQLTWPSGTLLQASNLAGPWTTNSAPSPFTVAPSAPQMFYKVQLH